MKMEAKAQLRNLRMTPRKTRLLVDLVRGMKVEDALVQLQFSQKHASRPLLKLLESCIANAVNNHNLQKDSLVVKTIFVDEGKTLKRWMPRAMGRATPIRKRTSHTTVILEGEVDEKLKTKIEKVKTKKTKNKEDKKTKKQEVDLPTAAETVDSGAVKEKKEIKKKTGDKNNKK